MIHSVPVHEGFYVNEPIPASCSVPVPTESLQESRSIPSAGPSFPVVVVRVFLLDEPFGVRNATLFRPTAFHLHKSIKECAIFSTENVSSDSGIGNLPYCGLPVMVCRGISGIPTIAKVDVSSNESFSYVLKDNGTSSYLLLLCLGIVKGFDVSCPSSINNLAVVVCG